MLTQYKQSNSRWEWLYREEQLDSEVSYFKAV